MTYLSKNVHKFKIPASVLQILVESSITSELSPSIDSAAKEIKSFPIGEARVENWFAFCFLLVMFGEF